MVTLAELDVMIQRMQHLSVRPAFREEKKARMMGMCDEEKVPEEKTLYT